MQPNTDAQIKYKMASQRLPEIIPVQGRKFRIYPMRRAAQSRISKLLVFRQVAKPESGAKGAFEAMKKATNIPYRIAAIALTNDLRLILPFYERIYAWILGAKYSQEDIQPIIQKAIERMGVSAFFLSMGLGEMMLDTLKQMTTKEVGQFRQGLRSEVSGHSAESLDAATSSTTGY